jgi:hypothetical protein
MMRPIGSFGWPSKARVRESTDEGKKVWRPKVILQIESTKRASRQTAEQFMHAFREYDKAVHGEVEPPAEEVFRVERVEDGWVVTVDDPSLDVILECE